MKKNIARGLLLTMIGIGFLATLGTTTSAATTKKSAAVITCENRMKKMDRLLKQYKRDTDAYFVMPTGAALAKHPIKPKEKSPLTPNAEYRLAASAGKTNYAVASTNFHNAYNFYKNVPVTDYTTSKYAGLLFEYDLQLQGLDGSLAAGRAVYHRDAVEHAFRGTVDNARGKTTIKKADIDRRCSHPTDGTVQRRSVQDDLKEMQSGYVRSEYKVWLKSVKIRSKDLSKTNKDIDKVYKSLKKQGKVQ